MTSAAVDQPSGVPSKGGCWTPLTPFQTFAVMSLALVLMVIVGLNLFLSYFLAQTSLRRDADLMTKFVNSMVVADHAHAAFTRSGGNGATPKLWRFLNDLTMLPDVIRTAAFDNDGKVIWSSDRAMIGRTFVNNPELQKAFRGETVVSVSTANGEKREHIYQDDDVIRFVEAYLPIWSRSDAPSKVIGVVEIYRRPVDLFGSVLTYTRVIWYAGAAAAMLLYGVVFFLFWCSSRTISQQQSQLLEADQLARMGEMASAVSHGIRNPLASIRSSAELALAQETSPATSSTLQAIISESDRLEDWIRQYLIHADGHGEQDQAHIEQVLLSCIDHINPMIAQKQIELRLKIDDNISTCRINPLVFFQVTYSLIANAIDAMPKGGWLAVRGIRKNEVVEVTIEDSGLGMSKEQTEEAMKPFVTSKPTGLGLGLPLARQILNRHGGRLEIESALGYGTRATIVLPTAPATG